MRYKIVDRRNFNGEVDVFALTSKIPAVVIDTNIMTAELIEGLKTLLERPIPDKEKIYHYNGRSRELTEIGSGEQSLPDSSDSGEELDSDSNGRIPYEQEVEIESKANSLEQDQKPIPSQNSSVEIDRKNDKNSNSTGAKRGRRKKS